MPPRIAAGPVSDPGRLKALILADPSIVEEGFRVLDADLSTGPAGTIDLVAVDGQGSLAIVAIAGGDTDAALLRLLDQYGWATDERDLLGRLYASGGVVAGRPARCLLLAPAFSHAFLRRLSLLSVAVTPYLVRGAPARGAGALVEPAAAIFGLPPEGSRSGAERRESAPAEREADEPPVAPVDLDFEPFAQEMAEEFPPLPEAEATVDPLSAVDGREAFVGPRAGSVPPAPFETLTAEEMEEFERFDRLRRDRGGRSS